MEYTTLTKENLDSEHICCAIASNKDPQVLAKKAFDSITDDEWKGTNLVFVERYFSQLGPDEYDNLHFSEWINCNRIEDFNKKLEA